MKLFELHREVDETGVSGTGKVAQGVIFDSGQCALTWLTKHTSCAVYPDIETVIAIHGHDGKTKAVQIVDGDRDSWAPLVTNAVQDDFENVNPDQGDSNSVYVWEQRGKLVALFDEKDLADGD